MGSALGNLARLEGDNNKSKMLQKRAISYLEGRIGSEEPMALILINLGYHCQVVDSAIYYFNRAINMVSVEFAPEVIIGAYNNMAYCYLYKGDVNSAEKCIADHALPVSIKTNNVDWQATYDTYADVLKQKGSATEATVYKNKSIEARKIYRASVSTILTGLKKY